MFFSPGKREIPAMADPMPFTDQCISDLADPGVDIHDAYPDRVEFVQPSHGEDDVELGLHSSFSHLDGGNWTNTR